MTPETRARLEQLAASWRDHADKDSEASTDAYDVCLRVCADELEALLSSLEPAQAQEPPRWQSKDGTRY